MSSDFNFTVTSFLGLSAKTLFQHTVPPAPPPPHDFAPRFFPEYRQNLLLQKPLDLPINMPSQIFRPSYGPQLDSLRLLMHKF